MAQGLEQAGAGPIEHQVGDLATTTWDQPGETTDPADCAVAGTCRRCPRCGGHSANVRARVFLCENCGFEL